MCKRVLPDVDIKSTTLPDTLIFVNFMDRGTLGMTFKGDLKNASCVMSGFLLFVNCSVHSKVGFSYLCNVMN